jgi:hypothetical protein
LVDSGELTEGLRAVLTSIFALYADENQKDESLSLKYTDAARLWYRCGLKLSSLDSLLDRAERERNDGRIVLEDFLSLFERVAEEDEQFVLSTIPIERSDISFQVSLFCRYLQTVCCQLLTIVSLFVTDW